MNRFVFTVRLKPGRDGGIPQAHRCECANVVRARTGVPALRRARTQGANDRIFLYEIYDSRATFRSLAVAALRHIQQDQRRPGYEQERC
jgi:hypothetical protein